MRTFAAGKDREAVVLVPAVDVLVAGRREPRKLRGQQARARAKIEHAQGSVALEVDQLKHRAVEVIEAGNDQRAAVVVTGRGALEQRARVDGSGRAAGASGRDCWPLLG